MNVQKVLEEIKEIEKKFVIGHEVLFALGATGIATEIEETIRSHMNHNGDDTEMDGWILVSERLPEDGETVLCTDGEDIFLVEYDVDLDAGFGDMDWIIAWQPLPEPYKGGE